jgi:ABC-type glycerol-3-phosphate transport system substrate-binding protein
MQPQCDGPARLFHRTLPVWSALLAAAVAAGCNGRAVKTAPADTAPEPAARRAGPVIACPEGPARQLLLRAGAQWANAAGAEPPTFRPVPAGPDAVADADIVVIRPWDLGRWAAAGVQPVPEAVWRDSAFQAGDLFPVVKDKLLVWGDRRPVALPLTAAARVIVFHTGKVKTAPQTWQDFAAAAEAARKAAGDKPSLPPLPADADDLDALFFDVAAPLARMALNDEKFRTGGGIKPDEFLRLSSFLADLHDGRPLVAEPGFVAALELLQRLQKCRPPGTAASAGEAVRSGQAALAVVTMADLAAGLPDHWQIAPIPGSRIVFERGKAEPTEVRGSNAVPYVGAGGWLAVVPAKAARADDAWAILGSAAGPGFSGKTVGNRAFASGPFRDSHIAGTGVWRDYDLPPGQDVLLDQALRTWSNPRGQVTNPVLRLRTPDQAAYAAVLHKFIDLALSKEGVPAEAMLKAVESEWKKLDARTPEKTRVANLRIAAGV